MSDTANEVKCENCTEWEYFEGYGYGCFCRKTLSPLDAEKCEDYSYKYKSYKDLKRGAGNDKRKSH